MDGHDVTEQKLASSGLLAAEPLACQSRGDLIESVHVGHLLIKNTAGQHLFCRGNPSAMVFARSALKPLQALPLWLTGAARRWGLDGAALAITLSSHSGEDVHVAAVNELLARCGLEAHRLQCGVHTPYHSQVAKDLIRRGEAPGVLRCNCSGKHAGMLAVCAHMGWCLDTYRDSEHPLQRMIRDLLLQLADVASEQLSFAIDGCGVPVWHLPLEGLATFAARLAAPETIPGALGMALSDVSQLMADHPYLIAGEGRLDTDLMQTDGQRFFAKIGGEAVHLGGVRGRGIGWAIKVNDGQNRAIAPALNRALEKVGEAPIHSEAFAKHVAPRVTNNRAEVVGYLAAAF